MTFCLARLVYGRANVDGSRRVTPLHGVEQSHMFLVRSDAARRDRIDRRFFA